MAETAPDKDTIPVEVAYARPDVQVILELEVPRGTTLVEAIRRSGILERFPEIDLARNKVGIFGRLSKPDTVLREGDRVEIYRPLIADPKASRRKRAEKKKQEQRRDPESGGST